MEFQPEPIVDEPTSNIYMKKLMNLACLALLGVGGMQAQNPFKLMKISKEEVKKFTDNFSKSDAKKVAAMFEDDGEITEEEEARNQNDARREKQKALLKIAKDMTKCEGTIRYKGKDSGFHGRIYEGYSRVETVEEENLFYIQR